jgi:methyl-accepting chemotaxis protein
MFAWFLNLKIRTKLLVSAGSVMLAVAGVGAFAVRQMSVVNAQSALIAEEWLPGVERIGAIEGRLLTLQLLAYQYIEAASDSEREAAGREVDTKRRQLDSLANAYEETIYLDTDRALFTEYRARVVRFQAAWPPIQALARAGRTADASRVMATTMRAEWNAVHEVLDKLIVLNREESLAASAKADRLFVQSRLAILTAVLALIALGLGVAWMAGGLMEKPLLVMLERANSLSNICLASLRDGLAALARGDTSVTVAPTTQRINSTMQDEVGMASRTIDQVIDQTRAAMQDYSTVQQKLDQVLHESRTLLAHAHDGDFSARADSTGFDGRYGDLVNGMNELFGAVEAPLTEARQTLARVAARDLTARMQGDYRGAFGALKSDINGAVGNLAETLAQVQVASEQVAAAGEQITSASQSLASGASEQAAGLEEVASSTTEFASMAKSTAANALEATALARKARASADDGSAQMSGSPKPCRRSAAAAQTRLAS